MRPPFRLRGYVAPGYIARIMPPDYHPPVKRSIEIAGHKTSISLEPVFWRMLRAEAARRALPINAVVAMIDAERIVADTPPGLASAIRVWLVSEAAEPGAQLTSSE